MSLCFAAITPHPPLLVPTIGKEEAKKIDKTKKALNKLEQELYASKPQIIMIISPHSGLFESSFSVNANAWFVADFKKFGDLVTKKEWKGAPDLAAILSHESKKKNIPLQLISEKNLDHGASVPLFCLTNHLEGLKILPIGYSKLTPSYHINFGELLKDLVMSSNKRIAVIASGDMAHGIDNDKSGQRENFDKEFARLITEKAIGSILSLNDEIVCDVDECGYRSVLILLGIMKNMDYRFNKYCYEHPFGVGYLTGIFSF